MSFFKWANLTVPVTASRPLNTRGSESKYSEREKERESEMERVSFNLTADKRDSNNRLCKKKDPHPNPQENNSRVPTITAERNHIRQKVVGVWFLF